MKASLSKQPLNINNPTVPQFLYGTAWKEDRTANLVIQAVKLGFRGIDTANQRKHYFEEAVGDALSELYQKAIVSRDEFFANKIHLSKRPRPSLALRSQRHILNPSPAII